MKRKELLEYWRNETHKLYKDTINKDMEKKWEQFLKKNGHSVKKLKATFYEFEKGNFVVDIHHIDYNFHTSENFEGNDYLYEFADEVGLVNWLDDDYTLQKQERVDKIYGEQ